MNNKQKTSKIEKYKLKCVRCPKIYTYRNFKIQLPTRYKRYINMKSRSSCVSHLVSKDYQINKEFVILYNGGNNLKLDCLE